MESKQCSIKSNLSRNLQFVPNISQAPVCEGLVVGGNIALFVEVQAFDVIRVFANELLFVEVNDEWQFNSNP